MKTIPIILLILFGISSSLCAGDFATVDTKDVTLKQLTTERPDLIADIKADKDQPQPTVTVVNDEKGRTLKWTEDVKDIEGKLVSRREDVYTYYKTVNAVDTITQSKYDANLKLICKKVIKHYLDGGQPDVSDGSIDVVK